MKGFNTGDGYMGLVDGKLYLVCQVNPITMEYMERLKEELL